MADENITTVRRLRMLSKEFRTFVSEATTCSVHLGEGESSPDPEQLVQLYGRADRAMLEWMKVTVTVMTGG